MESGQMSFKLGLEMNDTTPKGWDQNYEAFDECIKYSGVIQAEWMHQNKLQCICYGTGVAISKRIVLTCAHSVYHQTKKKVCNSVSFIPNHKEGKIQKNQKIFTSTCSDFIKLQQLKQGQNFGKYPLSQDLAFIYLSEDLQFDDFPAIGVDTVNQIQETSQIMICGYPSMGYYKCSDLKKIDFERVPLYGHLADIIGDTIYHRLETKTGHSGSAIFGINTLNSQPTIVGIHTHKGRRKNSGVYLNRANLKRLSKFQIYLGLCHHQYQMNIKFPAKIKQEAFHELKHQERQLFRNRKQYYCKMNGMSRINQYQQDRAQDSDYHKSLNKYHEKDQQSPNSISQIHNIYLQRSVDNHQKQPSKDQKLLRIKGLIKNNSTLKQKIISNFQYTNQKNCLFKWIQAEKHFLKIYQQLQPERNTPRHKRLAKEVQIQVSTISEKIKKFKNNYDRIGNFDIICLKFPPINEHLKKCKEEEFQNSFIQIC